MFCSLLSCGCLKPCSMQPARLQATHCTAAAAPQADCAWASQIREILQAGIDAGKAGEGSNGSQEPETFFDAKDDADEELPQAEQVPGPGKITTLGTEAAQHLDGHVPRVMHGMFW